MRIAKIIGTVTLNRHLPSFKGARLKLAVPYSLDELTSDAEPAADTFVLWDDIGAGIGDKVAMAEGPEASQPFRPELKPVEAYNAAILDHIDIRIDQQDE